jgi:signal transduction histidine kinase
MQTESKAESKFETFQDNIKIITASIISVILILTVTFIVKTYYDQESTIISDLHIEADRIEKFLNHDLQYTNEVLEIIRSKIEQNPDDYGNIKEILKYYKINPNVSNIFNWLYFGWIDENLIMKVSNFKNNSRKQIDLSCKSYANISKILPNKTFYSLEQKDPVTGTNAIIAIEGVQMHGQYLGSLVAAFDTEALVSRLNEIKKNEYTNFALIDSRLSVILKSKDTISKVGFKDTFLISNNLTNIMKRLDFHSDHPREFSYINMLSGLNYYVRKVHGLPFVLLVNIDHTEIQGKVLNKVLVKFTEIAIYTCLFLAMVISVYRRETSLRSKAERSYMIASKAVQDKTEFLAYTAHEIRSPLGFILTSSEIMQKNLFGEIPKPYEQYVNGINQNSNRILDFITDILNETYIAEGNFEIENKITDINALILESVENNATRFSERKVKIEYKDNPNLPKLVCDERRILQTLNNIISNAIKYSYDYTIVTISTAIDKDGFYITVADQGVGMAEEDIKIALTKYGTVKKKKTGSLESYGLGLAIVRKLIEAHEGSLLIKSAIGQGSEVTITFPTYKIVPK